MNEADAVKQMDEVAFHHPDQSPLAEVTLSVMKLREHLGALRTSLEHLQYDAGTRIIKLTKEVIRLHERVAKLEGAKTDNPLGYSRCWGCGDPKEILHHAAHLKHLTPHGEVPLMCAACLEIWG